MENALFSEFGLYAILVIVALNRVTLCLISSGKVVASFVSWKVWQPW